ncbi:hypothetical protein FRC08_012365 [Ceratobasidium sp. 394]|nr:hypothetical protein FRC08_012365 [Ceratobasidium sp. 394]
MPQLQTLRIGVVPGDLFSGLDIDLREIKRHRRSPFRTLEVNFLAQDQYLEKQDTIDSFSYQEAMTLTRYLFSLWPNVRLEEKLHRMWARNTKTAYRKMELINDHLAALSCRNDDPTMEYEKIDILNPSSWMSVK